MGKYSPFHIFFLQNILRTNIWVKPERLVFQMVTAMQLLYAERQKNTEIPIMEEWIVKMMDPTEMTNLTC